MQLTEKEREVPTVFAHLHPELYAGCHKLQATQLHTAVLEEPSHTHAALSQTPLATSIFATGLKPIAASALQVPTNATITLPSARCHPSPGIVVAGYQKAHVAGG